RFLPRAPDTTDPSALSLHDALPIFRRREAPRDPVGRFRRWHVIERGEVLEVLAAGELPVEAALAREHRAEPRPNLARSRERVDPDRKSTRLNSSHRTISYAVFCLKK